MKGRAPKATSTALWRAAMRDVERRGARASRRLPSRSSADAAGHAAGAQARRRRHPRPRRPRRAVTRLMPGSTAAPRSVEARHAHDRCAARPARHDASRSASCADDFIARAPNPGLARVLVITGKAARPVPPACCAPRCRAGSTRAQSRAALAIRRRSPRMAAPARSMCCCGACDDAFRREIEPIARRARHQPQGHGRGARCLGGLSLGAGAWPPWPAHACDGGCDLRPAQHHLGRSG